MDDVSKQRRIIANMDADKDVTLKDVTDIAKEVAVEKDAEIEKNADVLSMQDDELEPAELQEVVTTVKLMTEVVTATIATITAATTPITAPAITIAPSAARRRKGVVIRDPDETATPSIIIHYEPEFKDKGRIMVKDPKPLKKQARIEQDKAYTREEDLEVLWQFVKEIFASSKPKNFFDDFLLTTLTYVFEKPDVQAQVWKNQRTIHGLAKVKTWRLLESCGVNIITFTTTQMILLVERRYPLTRFTLDQMLNNVRLEVEEESEVSLELLRFVRQQQQEGFRPE
nr:hypothetical protein [Tanacetum cinerariifolium]